MGKRIKIFGSGKFSFLVSVTPGQRDLEEETEDPTKFPQKEAYPAERMAQTETDADFILLLCDLHFGYKKFKDPLQRNII